MRRLPSWCHPVKVAASSHCARLTRDENFPGTTLHCRWSRETCHSPNTDRAHRPQRSGDCGDVGRACGNCDPAGAMRPMGCRRARIASGGQYSGHQVRRHTQQGCGPAVDRAFRWSFRFGSHHRPVGRHLYQQASPRRHRGRPGDLERRVASAGAVWHGGQ